MKNIFEVNPSIDVKIATDKGYIINNQLSDIYLDIQKKYLDVFNSILSKVIDLKSIEKNFLKYNLKTVNSDNKYLNLLSNMNIEILSKENIDILNGNDENAKKIVVINTLKDVICVNYYKGINTNKGKISYYDDTYDNLKKYNSIVFSISVDKYSINTSNWDEFSNAIDNYIENIKKYINDNIKKIFDCETEFVIIYTK